MPGEYRDYFRIARDPGGIATNAMIEALGSTDYVSTSFLLFGEPVAK